jgi:DNA-binding transcriptional ArsR family regulator
MSLGVSGLRAVAHPVRLRMLSLLTGSAMSASELARELELTQANASYHLRTLVAAGLVSPAGQERVRGGTAKRYRYDVDVEMPGSTEAGEQPLLAEALATELLRRARWRRPDRTGTTTDAELWVAPEAWEEARSQVAEVTRRLHLDAQPPRTEGTVHVSATVMMFEMQPRAGS